MCPEQQVYLDHRQDGGPEEPMPIGYVRTLEDVYRFEPVPPGLSEEAARHIMGTQANVWTEVMQNRDRVDYQVFPRLAAFAEVAWSPLPAPGERDFAGFERRMCIRDRDRSRGSAGPASWVARSGDRPRPCDRRPTPGQGKRGKSCEFPEEWQFACRAEKPPKSGISPARGRKRPSWTLASDSPEDVPELPRPGREHVPYGGQAGLPGHREGAAGLTTHAPQAMQSVTLPASLDEAVAALGAMPAAVPVAGGTDLMSAVNKGLLRPAGLVGLGRISELRGWHYQDGHALLGAGLTHARMGRPDFAALIPALAASARAAGPPQIRNAGTLGGNIATAAPTGDTLPVLAALEAELVIVGAGGSRREIPVSHLLAGREMLEPAELIGFVRVPLLHAPQVFLKATGRTGPGRATASVAIVLDPARRGVRCAVGAIAPMPLRPLEAERWIASLIDWDGERGLAPDALAAFGEYVAAACIPDQEPPEDGGEAPPLSPAVLHLRRTVAALARRALGRALS